MLTISTSMMMASNAYCANAITKARTIGELIVTLLAGGGTAFTSPAIITPIYSNYSVPSMSFEQLVNDGILTPEDGTTGQTAIEKIGTGTKFEIDVQRFRDLVYTNWSIMQQNNIDTVLRFNNIANTDSVYGAIDNLGQIVKNTAQNGYLTLQNTIEIVNNPGVAVTVGLNNIWDLVKNAYEPQITSGIDIYIPYDMTANYTNALGKRFLKSMDISNGGTYTNPQAHWINQEGQYLYVEVNNDTDGFLYYFTAGASPTKDNVDIYDKYGVFINSREGNLPYRVNQRYLWTYVDVDYNTFRNVYNSNINNVWSAWNNGQIGKPYAPNIINPEYGNVQMEDDVQPSIDNNQVIDIIPSSDYENYMDEVNNTDTPQEAGEVTNVFINNYINEKPEPQVTTIPPQPTQIPKPTLTPEDTEETMQLTTTPGLTEVFPFCLPWDVVRIYKAFQAERKAPYFKWDFDDTRFGYLGTIELDFEKFDTVATIFRMLVLIGYILILAIFTRRLIGA